MVFCDICLLPVMGFGWRLAKDSDTGDLYDLCWKHYNENKDPCSGNPFHCNIPSGDLYNEQEKNRQPIKPRAESANETHELVGLFKGARVKDLSTKEEFNDAKVVKIEHKNKNGHGNNDEEVLAQQDMKEASYYNCIAEVEVAGSSKKKLTFRNAGCKGMVDLEVVIPGKWDYKIFATHHPLLCMELLREITSYEESCYEMAKEEKWFLRKRNGKCYSITVFGSKLKEITDINFIKKQCDKLEILIVYMSKLMKLPEELKRFDDSMRLVCIQNDRFTEIPKVLYGFTNLKHLDMHGNYLNTVPTVFGNFKNLERVYLGDNDLVTLPDVFNGLVSLKKASFKSNRLTRLPQSFSTLSQLENLDISFNAFIEFPQILIKLQSLKFLNIERNRIQRFTPPKQDNAELYEDTYKFIKQLSHMRIQGNPISEHKSIKNIKDKDVFYELSKVQLSRSLRVNVLGNSGAGKTSFVEAVTFEKYVLPTDKNKHRHTVGIDHYYFPLELEGGTILLNIWDHAGDNEYAMMNDLFISDESLVWLVVNFQEYEPTNKFMDQDIFEDRIGKWLLMVVSHNLKPVVWIICSHAEDCNDYELEIKKGHIEHWSKELCECLKKSEADSSVSEFLLSNLKIIDVTNTYGLKGKENIISELKSLPLSFPNLMTPLPVEWLESLDKIRLCAETELNYLEPESSQLPVVSIDDLKDRIDCSNFDELLFYLHNVGEIYMLKSPHIAVIDVNWIINLLKEVYHRDPLSNDIIELADVENSVINSANAMKTNYGFFSEVILQRLWKCNERTDDVFSKIIELFTKFDLTYKFIKDKKPCYFFPYLAKLEHEHVAASSSACGSQNPKLALTLDFSYFLPKYFLQRLALHFLNYDEKPLICSDGFEAKLSDHVTLRITDIPMKMRNMKRLKILVYSNDPHYVYSTLWCKVFQIFKEINSVLSTYWNFKSTLNKLRISCPKCPKHENNDLELFHFSEKNYEMLSSKLLLCKTCKRKTLFESLVPPSNFRTLPLLLPNLDPCRVVQGKDNFISMLSQLSWSLDDTEGPEHQSTSGIDCQSYTTESSFPPPQQAT